jgi:hypothetical protein
MNGKCDVDGCNIKAIIKLKNNKEYCPFHIESRTDYYLHRGELD